MKKTILLAAAILLPLFASCGDGETSASELGDKAASAVGDLDIDALDPAKLKDTLSENLGGLTDKLSQITDLESAKKLVPDLSSTVNKLIDMKDKLGTSLPDMGSLTNAITSLKDKFSGDAGVMAVLKPLLDQLQKLVG